MPPIGYNARYKRGRSSNRTSSRSRSSSRSTVRRFSVTGSIPYGTPTLSASYEAQTYPTTATSITGGGSGKSSGFISTKLRATGQKTSTFNQKGVSIVREVGGIINGGLATANAGNVIAVGHASCAPRLAHEMMWRAIIKKLLVKAGICDLSDFDRVIDNLSVDDRVRIRYGLSSDTSNSFATYSCVPGTTTPNVIADFFSSFFVLNFTPDLIFYDVVMYNIGASSRMGQTLMSLKNVTVVFSGKSTLKIQNQSVEETGDEESVNNIPLHGKAYSGKGNGTESFNRDAHPVIAASGFRADNIYGAIAKVPTEKWFQEVVPASQFTNIKSFGKVVLDPGHVKTSVLNFYAAVPLSTVYRRMFGSDIPGKHPKCFLGEYRFMLLEKMINATIGGPTNGIKVSYEVNYRLGCYVVPKPTFETSQLNAVANHQNEI